MDRDLFFNSCWSLCRISAAAMRAGYFPVNRQIASCRAGAERSARQGQCLLRGDDDVLLVEPFAEGLRLPGSLREGIKPGHDHQIDESPLQELLVIGSVTSHNHN